MNIEILDNSTTPYAELVALREKIAVLSQQLDGLHNDVRFIKTFFLEKQAKKARQRRKKEQKRLEIEKERKAKEDRSTYEHIVWEVKNRPWHFMPDPSSKLSPKELELVSLLVQGQTDKEIAEQMELKENSVTARICAANKKLELNSREELIAHYLDYQNILRKHRHRRCLILLSWLLNPPPGFTYHRNLNLTWKRTLGRGRKFYYKGPYIPQETFDRLRNYEHAALKLKLREFNNAEIAERLKIKETTLRSYFAEICSTIRRTAGVIITSDQALIVHYKEYLKLTQKRKQQNH